MDVLEQVREVNADTALTKDQIRGARSRLVQRIDEGGAAARTRSGHRLLLPIAGLVAGVAAVTATLIVVSQLGAPTIRVEAVPTGTISPRPQGEIIPRPDPTSGTTATEPFPGTTPQAGQYLRVVTTDERVLYRSQGQSWFYEWAYRPAQSVPLSAAVYRNIDTLYMPGDRSGVWVGRYGPSNERVTIFTREQSTDDGAAWDAMLPFRAGVEEWTYTGGIGGEILPLTGSLESYDQYPNDPAALVRWFHDRAVSFGSSEEEAEELAASNIIDVLTTNYAPADIRAAFVEALPLTGEAEQIGSAGSVVTYRFRFTHMSDPCAVTLSIDMATGWAVEYTSRFDRIGDASVDLAPADVPDIRRTFEVSVVDSRH